MNRFQLLKMKAKFRTREDYPGTILFFDCGAAFVLNNAAKIIIQGIQQEMSPEQIILCIHHEYPDVPLEKVERDTLKFLTELQKCGAI